MPRPATFDEPATVVITVRVTPSQKRDLAIVARENHTDMSGVVRDAVNTYVSEYREAPGLFRRTQQER